MSGPEGARGRGTSREVALVTGGAVRIGRAIAERLAKAGYAVAIQCRRSRRAADELAEALSTTGASVAVVEANLADRTALVPLVEAAERALGPVTLLVNSAAAFEDDTLTALDPAIWDLHFDTNVRAPVMLGAAMAARLPADRHGAIVNVIDQRVWKLTPRAFSYTLAKSALLTATRTMAQSLAPRIRVNAVGPGPTLMSERQSAEDFARQAASLPLGRASSPAEVAEAVLYLARAESVTGQMIAVDGGQHIAWETPDALIVE